MATNKDYYEILGVSRSASDSEIKAAYRKLAREHHPDMVKDGDKTTAEQRFKEINEAYQILGDPQKKQMYDQYGHAGPGFGNQGAGGFNQGGWGPFTYSYSTNNADFGDFNPFDVFEDFFGFRGFGRQQRPQKGKNLYYELHIDFADAVKGTEKEINIESGKVKIKIPQGVHDGTEMRFSGKGMPGPNNLPSGDLYITFRLSTPKIFKRSGEDLVYIANIDFAQAALGDTLEVPIVDSSSKDALGTTKLKIPAGTQPNAQFLIRGKGMPRLQGSGNANIYVIVNIEIPKKLSRKQKDLLEEYRSI